MNKKMKKITIALVFGILLSLFFLNPVLGLSQNTSVNFNTGGVYCSKTNTTSSWINGSTGVVLIANASNNCNAYTISGYIGTCCPSGLSCNASASLGSNMCFDASAITRCDNYLDKASCENDDINVGVNSVGSNVVCGSGAPYNFGAEVCVNVTDCGCIWKSGQCQAIANSTTTCDQTGSRSRGYCTWASSILENNCNTSLFNMVITSKASWTNGNPNDAALQLACVEQKRNYPCPNTAKLFFTSNLGYALAIIILVGIYLILNRYRRKRAQIVHKNNFNERVSKKKKL